MNTFFSIVGALIVVGLVITVAAIMVSCVIESITKFTDRIRYDAKTLAQKELGVQLIRDSWWFSESKDAMHALRVIGEDIRDLNHYSVSQARNKWEGLRKQ